MNFLSKRHQAFHLLGIKVQHIFPNYTAHDSSTSRIISSKGNYFFQKESLYNTYNLGIDNSQITGKSKESQPSLGLLVWFPTHRWWPSLFQGLTCYSKGEQFLASLLSHLRSGILSIAEHRAWSISWGASVGPSTLGKLDRIWESG